MDLIEKYLPWLDGFYGNPDNAQLEFPDPTGPEIARELAAGWGNGDRLEFIRSLAGRWGEAAVYEVLGFIAMARAERDWRSLAAERGDDSYEAFKKALWEPLAGFGFEYSSEIHGKEERFRVTRCPHAAIAREQGLGKLFYHLACAPDPAMIKGFNPRIGFRRSRTLMEGADCCDHTYILP